MGYGSALCTYDYILCEYDDMCIFGMDFFDCIILADCKTSGFFSDVCIGGNAVLYGHFDSAGSQMH